MNNAIENEIIKLENDYWQAIKVRDLDACLRLTDDPCLIAGASGVARVDRKSFMSLLKRADYVLNDFKIKDAEVRQLSDDVVVLVYRVNEDMTVEGKPILMNAYESSTWIRREGRWVCAVHSEALPGDPFGRDRIKQSEEAA